MPFFDPETMGAAVNDAMATTDALLFGRRTWQIMAEAWPSRSGDPFADRMNEIKKYVFSGSLSPVDLSWTNSTLLSTDDVPGTVRKLSEEGSGDLVVMGSLTLARTLISHDLVDVYNLMIEPIRLGGGKRLFPEDKQCQALHLVSATTSKTGVQVCTYRPSR